jgi:hypothetical protein
MQSFPNYLHVSKKDTFPLLNLNLALLELRKKIHDFILAGDYESRLELLELRYKHFKNNDDFMNMLKNVRTELKLLGWEMNIFGDGSIVYIIEQNTDPIFATLI